MKRLVWSPVSFVLLLVLAALACTLPGRGPARPVPSPTPLGDTLRLVVPAYTYSLREGEAVPGTRLRYIGRSEDAFDVTIDGLAATKRIGDSFFWQGIVAPGVHATYNLRLTTVVLGAMPVAGSVELTIFNPAPVALANTGDVPATTLTYNNILLDHLIPPGRQIPGTTLVYEGISTQGGDSTSRLAELSGLSGYPYFALGDSLVWTGKLRDNVVIRHSLRLTGIDEDGLRLLGTAELWLTPAE